MNIKRHNSHATLLYSPLGSGKVQWSVALAGGYQWPHWKLLDDEQIAKPISSPGCDNWTEVNLLRKKIRLELIVKKTLFSSLFHLNSRDTKLQFTGWAKVMRWCASNVTVRFQGIWSGYHLESKSSGSEWNNLKYQQQICTCAQNSAWENQFLWQELC